MVSGLIGGGFVGIAPDWAVAKADAPPKCAWLSGSGAALSSLRGYNAIWDGYRLTGRSTSYDALGLALDRVSRFFGTRATFAFFEDGEHPNAGATPYSEHSGVAGTVLMGRRRFSEAMKLYLHGQFLVLLVIAHEFSHILQFASPDGARFVSRGESESRLRELHADFLAGFYFAELHRINRDQISGRAAAQILVDLGDTELLPTHGRPNERVESANAGYDLGMFGGVTMAGAFQRGLEFVLSRYR